MPYNFKDRPVPEPNQGPPTPTGEMTLNQFIDLVIEYKTVLSPAKSIFIGSVRQYTPDVRSYNATRAQVDVLAPFMRREWAAKVFQGYVGHQIIYQQPVDQLRTVLSVGLASATLVRLSSYEPKKWNYTSHLATQYITLTDTLR